ncbi:uncharacterized protein LOC144617786 [Crassostrea virginica]
MHSVTCKTFMIVIIVNLVHYNNGGCDVNDWPRSCLANFRIGIQKCEPCESGRYGCNCSENCPNNTYGPGCYTFCDCPEDEFCDPMVGCMNTTTTTHTSQKTTDRATYPVGSSLPPVYPVKATYYVESSPLPTPKNHFLSNLTVSLLVSVGTVVFFGAICAVILIRVSKQFYKRQYHIDAKSINADVSETDDQNNDTHSYLTISDRSDRLYAAVHYDEAEDRKSSSPISLRSIKEHYTSESDNSKASESYLTPLINDVEELKGDSPRSSDYEDVTTLKM